MIFKWLFGKSAHAEFDTSQIPDGDEKYTMADAKRQLKAYLVAIQYGESSDIQDCLREFSELYTEYKDYLSMEIESARDELANAKEGLRDAKSELAKFKKGKNQYLLDSDNEIDDYDSELEDYQEEINSYTNEVEEAKQFVELQRTFNRAAQPNKLKRLVPRYAAKMREPNASMADIDVFMDFDEPLRVMISYSDAHDEKTDRTVNIDSVTSTCFSGFCNLRKERRKFRHHRVLEYRPEDGSGGHETLYEYLLTKL